MLKEYGRGLQQIRQDGGEGRQRDQRIVSPLKEQVSGEGFGDDKVDNDP